MINHLKPNLTEYMIDFIGDIHGHADQLEQLLLKLGYSRNNNFYAHPERKVLFVGDYIDRGPKIRETLEIVKSMVDNGSAIALMGNHEYNALCFHFQETDGGHLRKHLIKNIIQHYETLKQFQNRQEEYEAYLDWFKTLPLFYETENFRAVHACWDEKTIQYLKTKLIDHRLSDDLINESVKQDTKFHEAIEKTLKGKEVKLPVGMSFMDKDGTERTDIRIKWWEDPQEMTYRKISVEPIPDLPESPVNLSILKNNDYYKEDEIPVFFGHYWLRGEPLLNKNNVCCLDYSVAKNGYLVSYSFDGELNLDPNKLSFV